VEARGFPPGFFLERKWRKKQQQQNPALLGKRNSGEISPFNSYMRGYADGANVIYNSTAFISSWVIEMADIIFIGLVLVFFGFSFWYVRGCDRL
jgi:hypothetical protein